MILVENLPNGYFGDLMGVMGEGRFWVAKSNGFSFLLEVEKKEEVVEESGFGGDVTASLVGTVGGGVMVVIFGRCTKKSSMMKFQFVIFLT